MPSINIFSHRAARSAAAIELDMIKPYGRSGLSTATPQPSPSQNTCNLPVRLRLNECSAQAKTALRTIRASRARVGTLSEPRKRNATPSCVPHSRHRLNDQARKVLMRLAIIMSGTNGRRNKDMALCCLSIERMIGSYRRILIYPDRRSAPLSSEETISVWSCFHRDPRCVAPLGWLQKMFARCRTASAAIFREPGDLLHTALPLSCILLGQRGAPPVLTRSVASGTVLATRRYGQY